MENEVKDKHPWDNRSRMAQDTLAGRVERRGDLTRISLSHGVRYGVYLELAMGKRFAALWPKIKGFNSRPRAGGDCKNRQRESTKPTQNA